MKVTVTGFNYEGALFRGIPSDTDQTDLVIELEGNEEDICTYILEEFSYGQDDEAPYTNLQELVNGYNRGDIFNGDGCGGVIGITVGEEVLFENEWLKAEEEPVNLGTVLVGTSPSLNELVREAL